MPIRRYCVLCWRAFASDPNFLFAGSDHGGERAAAMYTLIGSAKLNGLDPELYLRTVLAQIADHPISHIQNLLPWNLAPSLQTHSSQAA